MRGRLHLNAVSAGLSAPFLRRSTDPAPEVQATTGLAQYVLYPCLLPAGRPIKPPIASRRDGSARSLGQVAKRGMPPFADPSPGASRRTETHPTLVASAISSLIPGPIVELMATFFI